MPFLLTWEGTMTQEKHFNCHRASFTQSTCGSCVIYTLNRIPKEEPQWRNLRSKIGTWAQSDILELDKATRSLEQL